MTNTETPALAATDEIVVTDMDEVTPVVVVTEATFEAELVGTLFRYLTWVSRDAARFYSVDLAGYSPERRAGVAVLVDHGLVSERVSSIDGVAVRTTLRVTGRGREVLAAARAAADLAIVSQLS